MSGDEDPWGELRDQSDEFGAGRFADSESPVSGIPTWKMVLRGLTIWVRSVLLGAFPRADKVGHSDRYWSVRWRSVRRRDGVRTVTVIPVVLAGRRVGKIASVVVLVCALILLRVAI